MGEMGIHKMRIKVNQQRICSMGPRSLIFWLAVLLIHLTVTGSLAQNGPYFQVTGPCGLKFPEDHGAHAGYHTEWWYYTGNVQADGGNRYGFQLTFFRNQITPPGSERSWPNPHSAWRTRQLYLAHAALSDIDGKRFYNAEKMARGALGMAAVKQDEGITAIFLRNWSAIIAPSKHTIEAGTDEFSFKLSLTPLKGPVLHGEDGYSLKGSTPERASCYYSYTRLGVEGALTIHGTSVPVRGQAWMDHEFSSSPLEPGLAGWDWFSLQLSDNSELMVYLLRHEDGTHSQASGGTFIGPDGRALHLAHDEIQATVLDHWDSPHTRVTYPSQWQIALPSFKTQLTILPNLNDQELETPGSTRVTYWEGSVTAKGTCGGKPVSGEGYVELTGYAGPLKALR